MSSTTSRRPHRKTKTGCQSCKSRRIKCDEKKPVCLNCQKQSLCCEYIVLTQIRQVLSVATSPQQSNIGGGTTIPASELEYGADHGDHGGDLQLNLFHLELLHNYSISTALSVSNDPEISDAWRIVVPQLGLSCSFVMYGILALSALHLARSRPEKRDFYVSQAKILHQAGLRKSTAALANVAQENCSNLYIFASLTNMIALATPQGNDDLLILDDHGLSSWLAHNRSPRAIIAASNDSVRLGPLAPMFTAGVHRANLWDLPPPHNTPEDVALNSLLHNITSCISSPEHIAAYEVAIKDLKHSFGVIYQASLSPSFQTSHEPSHYQYEPADAFIWIFRLSDSFLSSLEQREKGALAIFAHFCVLLKRLEGTWWMEGWSFHLLGRIWGLLGDGEGRGWILWPIEETGWVPPDR